MTDSVQLSPFNHDASVVNEPSCPEGISFAIWNAFDQKQRAMFSRKYQLSELPEGITCKKTWNAFSDEEKLEIASVAEKFKKKRKESMVLKFFFDFDADDIDFDSSVNAMALICALLLTIPFGLMPTFDTTFFDSLSVAILDCPGGGGEALFERTYNEIIGNFANVIYSCLCGLILSSLFYIFKQTDGANSYHKLKERALILCLFVATVCAVVGVMNLTTNIFSSLTVSSGRFCQSVSNVWGTGIFFVCATILVGFYLVY